MGPLPDPHHAEPSSERKNTAPSRAPARSHAARREHTLPTQRTSRAEMKETREGVRHDRTIMKCTCRAVLLSLLEDRPPLPLSQDVQKRLA